MSDYDVLAVGELNPDLVLAHIKASAPRLGTEQEVGAFSMTLGSSTAICAVRLRRLGKRVAMVARVGSDAYGNFCLERLREEGVVTEHILVDPTSQTGVTVSLAYPGDRLLMTFPGSMRELTVDMVLDELLERSRHLHVASFFLQEALQPGLPDLFARAKRLGVSTSLDTGWDPAERWVNRALDEVLAHTDYFFPNESELSRLAGEPEVEAAAQWALRRGAGTVVLKRGSRGATLYRSGAVPLEHPGYEVDTVDPTGAGDSFNAGFLYGVLNGWVHERSLRLANACGALATMAVGGTGGFRSLAEVQAFLASRGDIERLSSEV